MKEMIPNVQNLFHSRSLQVETLDHVIQGKIILKNIKKKIETEILSIVNTKEKLFNKIIVY